MQGKYLTPYIVSLAPHMLHFMPSYLFGLHLAVEIYWKELPLICISKKLPEYADDSGSQMAFEDKWADHPTLLFTEYWLSKN